MAEKKKTNTNKKTSSANKKNTAKKNIKGKTTTKKKTTQTKKTAPKKETKVTVNTEVKEKPKTVKTDKIESEKEVVIPLVTEAGQKINSVKEEIKEIIDFEEKTVKKTPKTLAKPTTILGKELPRGNDENVKKERRTLYAKDSLIFAIIVPLIDLIAMVSIESYPALNVTTNEVLNYLITMLTDFVLVFVVAFLAEYFLGERNIK